MKLGILVTAASIFFLCSVNAQAQAPVWGQCGGIGWSGPTTCTAGNSCTVLNAYYSQCLPASSSPTITDPFPTSPPPTTSTTKSGTSTSTTSGPAATGSQIRTVQDPVFHFYLQSSGGVPMLGPESSSGQFTIGNTIALNGSGGSKLYLNIDMSGTASYKPLSLSSTATTTDWGLEGDTIITTNPRRLDFLACASSNSAFYNVYLQEGNDVPSGRTCTLVTMHLPCLC
ncbi:hypothetical protein BD779DRAFT_1436211 [Infundibulicybe gibba]|nr:hypothetical protein BD779DRAFT_1436211 [Infundibulicybe gibba]